MSFSSRQCLVRWRLAYRRARLIRNRLYDYRTTPQQRDELMASVRRRGGLLLLAFRAADGRGDVLALFRDVAYRAELRRSCGFVLDAGPVGYLP